MTMIRNLLVGSAVAAVAAAQTGAMDLSTAEAVPTTCTAQQMTTIYNDCIFQCESTMSRSVIECTDVVMRHTLVKCAAAADNCDVPASATSPDVVRQAQIARLADVCSNGATSFPLADVTLIFASASDVADSLGNQQQVDALAEMTSGPSTTAYSANGIPPRGNSLPTTVPSTRSTRAMYSANGMPMPAPNGGLATAFPILGDFETTAPIGRSTMTAPGVPRNPSGGLYSSNGVATTIPMSGLPNNDMDGTFDEVNDIIDITQDVGTEENIWDAGNTSGMLYQEHTGGRTGVPAVVANAPSEVVIDDLIVIDGIIKDQSLANQTRDDRGNKYTSSRPSGSWNPSSAEPVGSWEPSSESPRQPQSARQTQLPGKPLSHDQPPSGGQPQSPPLVKQGGGQEVDESESVPRRSGRGKWFSKEKVLSGQNEIVSKRQDEVTRDVEEYTWSAAPVAEEAATSGSGKKWSPSGKQSSGKLSTNKPDGDDSESDSETGFQTVGGVAKADGSMAGANGTKAYGKASSAFKTNANATGKISASSAMRSVAPVASAVAAIAIALFFL